MSKDVVRVWIVDDSQACHSLVRRSLPTSDKIEISSYMSGGACLEDYDLYLADPALKAYLPDIVFMDFFLGDSQGDAVTMEIRSKCNKNGLIGPFLIGHSSYFKASEQIQAAGGDIAFRKNAQMIRSADICHHFPTVESLLKFSEYGQRPA